MNPSTRLSNIRFLLSALVCPALLFSARSSGAEAASIVPIRGPGATAVAASALNRSGQVAGVYYSGQMERAFLWSNGVALDLSTLGGAVSTAYALNNSGRVVGSSATGNEAEFHAFSFADGFLSDLGGLGGFFSASVAVNDAGQVAGYSFLAEGGQTHAFLHNGGVMFDLGTLGGTSSSATALNAVGQVAGESRTSGDAETHAFLYSAGVMRDLGTLGGTFSFATALNSAGLTTGSATTPDDAESHAFLHNGLAMQDLGTLGGTYSSGSAINDAGQVIGDSTLAGDSQSRGFIFGGGVMQDLGTLGGDGALPWAINNDGQVVGVSSDANNLDRAFLWQNGAMLDLNSLLPSGSGWVLNAAYFINDAGQIVGSGSFQGQPAWFHMTLSTAANRPPVAQAGPDQTVECTGATTAVVLDGTASMDPEGAALRFAWFAGDRPVGNSARLALGLSLGSTTFTLRVTDDSGVASEDSVVINVVDTTAPVIQCPLARKVAANRRGGVVPNFLAGLIVSDRGSGAAALVLTQSPSSGTLVGCGETRVTITASDPAGNRSSCTTSFSVVDVTPPVVTCVREVTRSARAGCQAALPDLSERIQARDDCTPADQLVITQSPVRGTMLGLGRHEIEVTVADAAGNLTKCTVLMHVVDRTPPRVTQLQANPEFLRDGNHEMVPVTLSLVATDRCDPHPVCRIVSITSSDPTTGKGDATTPDWKSTSGLTFQLRAERSAPDRLRVYTIKVACTDASGNTSTRTVCIPVRPALRPGAK